MKLTSNHIKEICLDEDAVVVGIAPVDRFKKIYPGQEPTSRLTGCRSVIVIGCPFSPELLSMNTDDYTETRIEMEAKVSNIASRVEGYLKQNGYLTRIIVVWDEKGDDIRFWDHKSMEKAAEFAGIGRVTRNQHLTSPVYGNLLWFAAILTDGEFVPDNLMKGKLCGKCDLCVVACPVGALNDPQELNQKVCDQWRVSVVEGEVKLGCYECRRACPARFGLPEEAKVAV